MKSTDGFERIDWRARLHSLPCGAESKSPAFTWFLRGLLGIGLLCAGSLFVLLSGAAFGLSRGVGPEQAGGVLYILPGLIFALLAGAGISALLARRSVSRTTQRLVFYSFTGPAFLTVLLIAFSVAKHLLG